MKQHIFVHVVQCGNVNSQSLGDTLHIQTKRFQQLQKVHFFTCKKEIEVKWEAILKLEL